MQGQNKRVGTFVQALPNKGLKMNIQQAEIILRDALIASAKAGKIYSGPNSGMPTVSKNKEQNMAAALKNGSARRDFILRHMAKHGSITSEQLGDLGFNVKRSSHTLNNMKNSGYVHITGKTKSRNNNTLNVYDITDYGRELLEALDNG